MVVLVDPAASTADAEALVVGQRVRARAVVRVVWTDDKATARLDVHVEPSPDWAHDELRFRAADAPIERGRTVGFAIASMVQRLEAAHEPSPAPPPPSAPPGSSPPPEPQAEPPPPPTRSPSARAFEAFAGGAAAFGGAATGYGGTLGGRWFPLERVGLRVVTAARFGSIDAASASDRVVLVGGGVVVRLARWGALGVEARSDFVVIFARATRSYPTGDVSQSRQPVGGADAAAEASFWLSSRTALTASAGGELAFGPTYVNVGGAQRAEIPSVRALTEIGVRVGF